MIENNIKSFGQIYEQIKTAQDALRKSEEELNKLKQELKEKDNVITAAKLAVQINYLHKKKLNLIDHIINDGDIHGGDIEYIQSVLKADNLAKLRQIQHVVDASRMKQEDDSDENVSHLLDLIKSVFGDACEIRVIGGDEEDA